MTKRSSDISPEDREELKALRELDDFLEPRFAQARAGEFSTKTIKEICAEARRQAGLSG